MTNPKLKQYILSYSFLLLAVVLTSATFVYFIFQLFPAARVGWVGSVKLICVGIFLSLNLLTMFYAGFVASLHDRFKNILSDDKTMIGSVGLCQGLLVVLELANHATPSETFFVLSVFQTWSTYIYMRPACRYLGDNSSYLKLIPVLAAAAMAMFALCAFPLRNWFPVPSLISKSTIWQASVLLGGFTAALVADRFPLRQKWNLASLAALFNSAASQQSSPLRKRPFVIAYTLPAAVLVGLWSFEQAVGSRGDSPAWILAGCSPLFLPALTLGWASLREQAELNSELAVSSRLTGSSALRILKRNLKQENAWAASVGLRTSVFTIDHDPDATMAQAMPSSIMQIRNEEIQRCINDVLKQRLLHHHTAGQKIYGALDAEQSTRPCLDIIKMFACLYLDAGPLIERRINGLSNLLPIINPGLSQALKTKAISTLLKQNQWFFHFDYHWVDQHLINTPGSTRYGVHLDPIANETRLEMVSYLQQTNGLGSFLWIGKDAHEKLMQEAPMLTAIIEPVSLKHQSGDDVLVFILKFENLIPRLQRYFDLDHTRKVLMDYEPGPEASKLINIFKVQSTQATTPEAMINLVESIASYPWRGFKEKDQALKIVVAAHQFSARIIEASATSGQPVPRTVLKLRKAIHSGVEKIGYPAQILHLAQMNKIAQRDMQSLLKSVASPNDSRFEEAWTLLASLDLRRHSRVERAAVAKLYSEEDLLATMLDMSEVHPKAIDTLINLIKSEHHLKDESAQPEASLALLSSVLAKKFASAETLSLLFDGITFLSSLFGRDMTHILTSNAALEAIVAQSEAGSSPFASSLWSRWIELQQRNRAIRSAA